RKFTPSSPAPPSAAAIGPKGARPGARAVDHVRGQGVVTFRLVWDGTSKPGSLPAVCAAPASGRKFSGPGSCLKAGLRMGRPVPWALGLLLSLLILAEAGRNFRLLRQQVLRAREVQAMKETVSRRRLLPGPGPWRAPSEGSLRQPLDHFDRQERGVFNQRFWLNEEFWHRPAGPVFLYVGGESSLSQFAVLSGHHMEMARKHGALAVALEHRFYGASINPDGLRDTSLRFLSSQQALADLASFHLFVTQKYNLTRNNTWICFGGSYPGSLAAWFRLKFPHLVFAAVASSAPVRAQLDFTGYNRVVAASLSDPVVGGSAQCREAVAQAFSTMDQRLQAGGWLNWRRTSTPVGP
ncbi:protease, serine 16, partial [Chelydra serpentina]